MKFLILLPLLFSCIPKSPKDTPLPKEPLVFDPLSAHAWHLENTGQDTFSDGYAVAGEDHKIKKVHELGFTGKGIKIAVSDNGVQVNHPDLEQNQLVNEHRNYRTTPPYKGDPVPEDIYRDSHGTSVTGLVSAVKGNTEGSYGVAPDSLFAGFNFLSLGYSHEIFLHQLTGDFNIFNYSYGLPEHLITGTYQSEVIDTLKQGVENGAVYVKAAGNDYYLTYEGTPIWSNANFEAEQTLPYYIVVGAINSRGIKSSYSSPGSNLWISGAGGEFGTSSPAMITTDLTGCSYGSAHKTTGKTAFDKGFDEANPYCDYTNTMNGTSSAAPVISGIIALMMEANPNLTWRDVKHILAKTADRVDYSELDNNLSHPKASFNLPGHIYDKKWIKNHAGNYFSNWYGFGRANALQAVLMASTYNFPLGTYLEETFTSALLDLDIPNTAVGVTDTINVSSGVSKIESVQVRVNLEHTRAGDLGIELTSPYGTTSKLFLINSGAIVYPPTNNPEINLLSNAFYEENPQGNWTLKIIDGSSDHPGKFKGWSIKINGH